MKKFYSVLFVLFIIFASITSWSFIIYTNYVDKDIVFRIIHSTKHIHFADTEQRKDDSLIVAYQNLFDVDHYQLKLSFDIPSKMLFGNLKMRAVSQSDTLNWVYLNLYDNMEVKFVRKDDQNLFFKRENDYVIIETRGLFKNGDEFEIDVNYSGSPVNVGFDSFSFKKFDNEWAIYTLSEPTYAPTWWPCKDLPTDKTTFEMIVTVPQPLTVASNGLLKQLVEEPDNSRSFYWETNYPTSTYLISLAIGKYDRWVEEYVSLDGTVTMPVEYYTYPSYTSRAKIDWEDTIEMIEFFSKLFGEYPFINEKYGMAMFGWTSGAMEHQTLSSMGYLLITGDKKYESVVVHELVHQWYGDAVSPESWKDIWLNEGFASYGEALWEEHKGGKQAYIDYLKSEDYGYFQGTVYDPEGFIFSPTVYQKGSWVLHMLRGVIGDSLFFQSIREYYELYKYKTANTWDLIRVVERISGQDLHYFFDQWVITGKGRPDYKFSWKADTFPGQSSAGVYMLRLNLRQTQKDYQIFKMPVKVTVKTEAGEEEFSFFNDKRTQQIEFPVKGKPFDVIIDKDDWILKRVSQEEYKHRY
jgi:aminopeptidase N